MLSTIQTQNLKKKAVKNIISTATHIDSLHAVQLSMNYCNFPALQCLSQWKERETERFSKSLKIGKRNFDLTET